MPRSLRAVFLATSFAVLSVALAGASCDKKPASRPVSEEPGLGGVDGDDKPEPIPTDHEASKVPAPPPGKPYPDPRLNEEQKAIWESLAEKLPSPCGKAHSLRVSLAEDPGCKRAPFAARYVKRWIAEEEHPEQIAELYSARYLQERPAKIAVTDTPFMGIPDAPVVIVEFFDYGCPHCQSTAPKLEDLAAEYPSDVVIYFKHFVLNLKSPSLQAAQAAVAAHWQGKFAEMHRRLFRSSEHSPEEIASIANAIGLDAKRFTVDAASAPARKVVLDDRDLGDDLDIHGTPAIFVNGKVYTDRLELEDLRDWVNEELAARN